MENTLSGESGFEKELHFTALGNLQREHTLKYSVWDNGTGWALGVSVLEENVKHEESIVLPDREQAVLLWKYLYENAVPIENWRDIIADAVYEIEITAIK